MNLTSPVFRFEELDSTNSEAKRRAQDGKIQSCWVVADTQTSGRGRLKRAWSSPVGNLYSTALFAEPGGLAVATRLPFALALAVKDTCSVFAPNADYALKWPNDVRIDGRKISGILVETGSYNNDLWIAAGIGINIASFPDSDTKPATSLQALGANTGTSPQSVFEALKGFFIERLEQARTGFETVRTDWLTDAEGLGKTVAVTANNNVIRGVFEDMDAHGGLILRLPNGDVQIIRAGDVNLVGRV